MNGEVRSAHEGPDDRRPGGPLHWVFHFIVLPLVFALSVVGIIGLASVYLSPGGYYEGNALEALRSWIPLAAGVLLLFAILAVASFAGLYGWRKWSLVTLIVLLVLLAAACAATGAAAWTYLAAHGPAMALVDPRFATVVGLVRTACLVIAVLAVLFIVFYARRSRQFVTAAELREREKLVTYEQW